MLQQGDVTSKIVSFIIKGYVHDRYLHGHKKIKQFNIEAYKIKTADDLPVLDGNKIPIPDGQTHKATSDDDGSYVIVFNGVPTGVYCINAPLNLLNPKYDKRSYYINIVESDTYHQDIFLVDTKKRQKIENDSQKVSIHEIFMVE